MFLFMMVVAVVVVQMVAFMAMVMAVVIMMAMIVNPALILKFTLCKTLRHFLNPPLRAGYDFKACFDQRRRRWPPNPAHNDGLNSFAPQKARQPFMLVL